MHVDLYESVPEPISPRAPRRGSAPKLRAQELMQFTQQITTLLVAGITLPDAVKTFRKGQPRSAAQQLLTALESDLGRGLSLSLALSAFPTSFDPLYLRLIAAGESSGTLEQAFGQLSALLTRKHQLQQKVRSALIHPLAISVVACAVSALLLIKVVPEFQQMFGQFDRSLPALTLSVISLSHHLRDYGLWWVGAIAFAGYALQLAVRQHAATKRFTHSLLLQLPLAGPITTDACTARFARTLATGYSAGLPIIDALTYAATAPGNWFFANATEQACTSVDQGIELNAALGQTAQFPDLLIHMISVGEQAGMLEIMLQRAADYYETRVDNAIDRLIPLLEPAMMVALGGLVGGLMLAMYLPLFQMGSVLG